MSLAIKLSERLRDALENPTTAKLYVVNKVLPRMIPFNLSTGAKLVSVSESELSVSLPNKRANHNHLGGIHACAIATVGEMAAGLLLLRNYPFRKYRIILKELNTKYLYQAKMDIVSTASMSDEAREQVFSELQDAEVAEVPVESRVVDVSGNLVAVVNSVWQLKSWELTKVRG